MRVNSMKVLVTGDVGFIGPHIAERLIEMGFEKESIYAKNPLNHYQTFTQADTRKAKKELKFIEKFDIKKGIREMLDKAAKA